MTVHYGPANGPDGLGQAMACGTADRWSAYTLDVTKVTCRRCLKTNEVRAARGVSHRHVDIGNDLN